MQPRLLGRRRHKDLHRRFNPPLPRIRNAANSGFDSVSKTRAFHLLKDTLQRSTILSALPYRTEPNRTEPSRSPFVLNRSVCVCPAACRDHLHIYRAHRASSASPRRRRETRNSPTTLSLKEFRKVRTCKAIDEEKKWNGPHLDRAITEQNGRRVCTRNKRA